MRLQLETRREIEKLPPGTVSEASMRLGVVNHEPLLVAMDALLRYAKAYSTHHEELLGSDHVLAPCFKEAIQGIRGLLNGDGAVAMERDITTDSKDNGVIEALYWHACREAGIDGDS